MPEEQAGDRALVRAAPFATRVGGVMFKTRYRASYKGIIIPCHRAFSYTPALRRGSRQPKSGRQRTAACDDGVGGGLCVGAAAGRGGGIEILSRISCCAARSFVISFVIWFWS